MAPITPPTIAPTGVLEVTNWVELLPPNPPVAGESCVVDGAVVSASKYSVTVIDCARPSAPVVILTIVVRVDAIVAPSGPSAALPLGPGFKGAGVVMGALGKAPSS
jgi:hypothetical protein